MTGRVGEARLGEGWEEMSRVWWNAEGRGWAEIDRAGYESRGKSER